MKASGSLSDIAGSVKGYLKKKQQRQSLVAELSQARAAKRMSPPRVRRRAHLARRARMHRAPRRHAHARATLAARRMRERIRFWR
jgi:hypothetical protein